MFVFVVKYNFSNIDIWNLNFDVYNDNQKFKKLFVR